MVLYGTSLSPRTRYVLPNTAAGAKSNTTAEVSIVAVTVANQLFSSGSAGGWKAVIRNDAAVLVVC